jgi:hypothetical protein
VALLGEQRIVVAIAGEPRAGRGGFRREANAQRVLQRSDACYGPDRRRGEIRAVDQRGEHREVPVRIDEARQ